MQNARKLIHVRFPWRLRRRRGTGPFHESVYRPLDPVRREARFLKLLPLEVSGRSDIKCEIYTYSLDSGVSFDALSYCWGDFEDTRDILVNGQRFAVTKNAFEFLEMFRATLADPEYLWIDAICINQDDTLEKNRQVQMMGDIYSRAKLVHIWLGRNFRNIETFAALANQLETGETPDDHEDLDKLRMESFETVLVSPWWSRLWVVQEALLASIAVFHCGNTTISWHGFSLASDYLLDKVVQKVYYTETYRDVYPLFITVGHTVNLFQNDYRSIKCPSDIEAAMSLITYINRRSVSDPRDRIYGMLGLLPSELHVYPDYDSSPLDIYREFTLRFMQWSGSSDVLRFCQDCYSDLDWPSWVPRFADGAGNPDYRWNAGGSTMCSTHVRASGRLAMRVRTVGSVALVGETWSSGDFRPEHEDILTYPRQILLNWWMLILSLDAREEQQTMNVKEFWKTLGLGNYPMLEKTELRDFAKIAVDLDIWLKTGNAPLGSAGECLRRFWLSFENYTLFVLDQGSIALSKVQPAEGDRVVIAMGCSRPLILRPQSDEPYAFKLLCDCYCSDVMDGEYIHEAARTISGCDKAVCFGTEMTKFLNDIRHYHFSRDDGFWLIETDTAMSVVKELMILESQSEMSEEGYEVLAYIRGVLFEKIEKLPGEYRPAVKIFEKCVETMRSGLTQLVGLVLVRVFLLATEAFRNSPRSPSEGREDEPGPALEDVEDLALRVGVILFEALIRIEGARSAKLTDETSLILYDIDDVFYQAITTYQASATTMEWFEALRYAAKQYNEVEANMDAAFEEVVLV